jgi:hypothetical protein
MVSTLGEHPATALPEDVDVELDACEPAFVVVVVEVEEDVVDDVVSVFDELHAIAQPRAVSERMESDKEIGFRSMMVSLSASGRESLNRCRCTRGGSGMRGRADDSSTPD